MTYPTGSRPTLPPEPGPVAPPAPPAWSPAGAPLSLAIIAACVAMFLLDRSLARPEWVNGHQVLLQRGALYGPLVQSGQWYRLLLVVLEHGGGLHLFFNMSVVWTLGQALERHLGTARFAVISIITALGASTLSLLFAFHTPMVGASGMILGWAGAMLPIATPQGRRGLRTWLIQIAIISLLPGVSWQGHLGGFLYGLPCGWALRGGAARFRIVAPLLLGAACLIAWVVGSGRFQA